MRRNKVETVLFRRLRACYTMHKYIYSGYGEGILEYKCVYRVEDNRRCSFVVNQSIEEVNRDAADENLLIKMTVKC